MASDSDNNTISNNIINNNEYYGIWLRSSHDNNITWNTLHDNSWCIVEYALCSGNFIENNDCRKRRPPFPFDSLIAYALILIGVLIVGGLIFLIPGIIMLKRKKP